MTNGNDVIQAKHLESTAMNAKRYVLGEILDLSQAIVNDIASLTSNDFILDTVASSVDGGLWFETTSTAPIIKFKQGDSTYYLYTNQLVSPNLSLSSSTVTVNNSASQTITLSYSGNGTITLDNPNTTALTASYDSTTKTITLTSNLATGAEPVSVNLGVALSEAGTYAADSQTLAVTCQGGLLNPQLTVTPSTATATGGTTITATVSYLGTGTVTVTVYGSGLGTMSDGSFNYNATTKVLTVEYPAKWDPYNTEETFTVSLSAADGYDAATATLTVELDL